MEEETLAGDSTLADEVLQSPRSPVQSLYGGSDAGDDVADQKIEAHDQESQNDSNTEEAYGDLDATQSERDEDDDEKESHSIENGGSTTEQSPEDNRATGSVIGQSETSANDTSEDGKKRFKYKYPEAYPTPPGWDDEVWNKAYTAADSRIYNHAKKNHQVSKQKRGEGVTRIEALQWEADRGKREAKKASKKGPKQQHAANREASSSTPTTFFTTIDADMANKKAQKKKKAPPATLTSSSSVQSNLFQAQPYEDLPEFQTLADRVKGKSAASAAASSTFAAESSTPMRAESEKATPPKKSGGVHAKKTASTKVEVQPPIAKFQGVCKPAVSKPRTSKSGTPASAPTSSKQYSELEQFSDEEAEDGGENELYCLCRTVASTNMVACDNCDQWFHRRASCLGANDPAIYRIHELNIDKWYCPTCKTENPSLQITWFPMCRRKACNKPARTQQDPPSKYCSEFCSVEFFREKFAQASSSSEPTMGGALTQAELGKAFGSAKSAAEFKQLGKSAPRFRATGQVVSKQSLRDMVLANRSKNGEDGGAVQGSKAEGEVDIYEGMDEEMLSKQVKEPRGDLHLEEGYVDIYDQKPSGLPLTREEFVEGTAKALGGGGAITSKTFLDVDWSFLQRHGIIQSTEAEIIHEHQQMMEYLVGWIQIADLKVNFIKAIRQYSAKILRARGLEPKTICGYLPVLSKNDFEFRHFTQTDEGSQICETGSVESLDPEQVEMWRKDSETTICMHSVKKHPAHFNWADTHEKENHRRRQQLTEDMDNRLRQLNDLLTAVHYRLVDGDWKPIL